jgi:hypothetical protein
MIRGVHTIMRSQDAEDTNRAVGRMKATAVDFTRLVIDRGWGLLASFKVPGALQMSIYQPGRPTAIGLSREAKLGRA